MADRAARLIQTLDLHDHPEGGYYREVFRSAAMVNPTDGREGRSSLTSIYFLLMEGSHSSWHVVRSDEAWHHYEGDPLELLTIDPDSFELTQVVLGPIEEGAQPVRVVAAGLWQAARPLGTYTLAGCSVGPGFDFADFTLMRDEDTAAARLHDTHPDTTTLL